MPVTTQDSGVTPTSHEVIYETQERRSGIDRRSTAVGTSAHGEMVTTATLTGGSSLELIGGGCAVVLSIIGLSGHLETYMTCIATIAIGAALLAHGAAVTARWSDTMQRAVTDRADRRELVGGIGSELLGGACAIVLGILALGDVEPFVLLASAAIVAGGTILLGAPAQPELVRLAPDRDPRMARMTYQAVEGVSGAMIMAGLGSIVLGILALLETGPVFTMVMVAMLVVGGTLLLNGTALTTRFARRLQQAR